MIVSFNSGIMDFLFSIKNCNEKLCATPSRFYANVCGLGWHKLFKSEITGLNF